MGFARPPGPVAAGLPRHARRVAFVGPNSVRPRPNAVRPYVWLSTDLSSPNPLPHSCANCVRGADTISPRTSASNAAGPWGRKARGFFFPSGFRRIMTQAPSSNAASNRRLPTRTCLSIYLVTKRQPLSTAVDEDPHRNAKCAYLCAARSLRDWEQGRSEPDQPAKAYLTVIARDHEGVERALHPVPS